MIYMVDEKDISALWENEDIVIVSSDTVLVFTKDMSKATLTGESVKFLLECDGNVNLVPAATREEVIFVVGGHVYSDYECTLIQMNIPIPDAFKEKVKVIEKPVKKASPSRSNRSRKTAQPAARTNTPPKKVVSLSNAPDVVVTSEKESESKDSDDSEESHT